MSYIRIWVHLVFSTKNRYPFITKSIKQAFLKHIFDNCKEKGILVSSINGDSEHIHCLLTLPKEMPISKVVNLIKGESSLWFNKQSFSNSKFEWQDDYFAVSVSESQLDVLKKYISNQENHHKKVSYSDEVKAFLEKFGFTKMN